MSAMAIAPVATSRATRAPSSLLLWSIAFAGCAAGAASLLFALTNDAIGAGARRAAGDRQPLELDHGRVHPGRRDRLVRGGRQVASGR